MLDPDTRKSYGVTSAILGWFVFFSFTSALVISLYWPQLLAGSEDQEYWRSLHMTIGGVSLFFVVLRLLWWIKNQRPIAPKGMSEKSYGLSRLASLLLFICVFALGLSGYVASWGLGNTAIVFGLLQLPVLDGQFAAIAAMSHSILSTVNVVVIGLYILVNSYCAIRYKVGFRRMLPGVHR